MTTQAQRPGMSEYDRFGPWIDEITTPDEVPPLYRDFPLDLEATRLVLKVPRDIARRDANPQMDLYDHVLILEASTLTVLSRRIPERVRRAAAVERGYSIVRIALADVVAVRDAVELLAARFTLVVRDGTQFTIAYNGAANAAIARLVEALRESTTMAPPSATGLELARAGARIAVSPAEVTIDSADLILANDFRAVAKTHPGLMAWASHGQRKAAPLTAGSLSMLQRVVHAVEPRVIHGAVVGGSATGLEIVGRREWVAPARFAQHSRSRLLMPLAVIDAVAVAPHPAYDGAARVSLVAGAATLTLVVPTNSDAYGVLASAAAR